MATTAQQIIDQARVPLNDADKARYTDTTLLGHLNFGLRFLRGARPDFFIGSLGSTWADLALTDAVPTPDEVDQPLADYVTARAQTLDDEELGENGRAVAFFAMAKGGL